MISDIYKHSSLRKAFLQEMAHEVFQERLAQEYNKGFKDAEKLAFKKGRRAGKLDGFSTGILFQTRRLLRELAVRHFGALDATTRTHIAYHTDIMRLEAALLQMAAFADEAALVAFLDATPDGKAPQAE